VRKFAVTLRFRLIALVSVALSISVALGGAIASLNASRSVRNEMKSALLVGRQTVENATDSVRNSLDPQHDLENFVRSFEGNRHLRVSLTGNPAAVAAPAVERSPFGEVPALFVRLIGVASVIDRVPIPIAGEPYATIVLETDPHNEMLEVWNEFNASLVVLALFCGQTIVLIYLFVGRALRPLDRLASALEQIGDGNYRTRVNGRLTPELSRLHDSFNRMASQLAATDADNRRLNEQLLMLQEQERSELARDLHDEVSPFLFAIKVDAANLSRLLSQGRSTEAAGHLRLIEEAVGHMQHEVRNMLGRLRPAGLAEFGLSEAIGNLVGFWRRRHP
jgi:two-component system, NarL family, sensor histidine kinase UhpB